MAATPIIVQDRSAIHDIVFRYAWYLDRGDIDRLAALFTSASAIHLDARERALVHSYKALSMARRRDQSCAWSPRTHPPAHAVCSPMTGAGSAQHVAYQRA